jgi:hypothetical protein
MGGVDFGNTRVVGKTHVSNIFDDDVLGRFGVQDPAKAAHDVGLKAGNNLPTARQVPMVEPQTLQSRGAEKGMTPTCLQASIHVKSQKLKNAIETTWASHVALLETM